MTPNTDYIQFLYDHYHMQVYKPDAVCTAKAINIEVKVDKIPSISGE